MSEFLLSNPAVVLLVFILPLYYAPAIIGNIVTSTPYIAHILRTASQSHVELPYTPAERLSSITTVLFAMVLLSLKHVGFGRKLGRVQEDGTVELPPLAVSAPIKVTENDIKAYHQAVVPKSQTSSSPSPILLLAPLTTPLIPSLLLLRANPIKPLGAVNTRNVFIFHDPQALHQLGSAAGGEGSRAEAIMGGKELLGRRVKRGVEFDTVITVFAAGDQTEKSSPIFTFTFTTLSLLSLPPTAPFYPKSSSSLPEPEPTWHVDPKPLSLPSSSTPLPWASLSKDYNPIHVSSLLAKLFGFKRNIAHGNMILAMVMERATSHGQDPSDIRTTFGRLWAGPADGSPKVPSWLVVDFKRPVFVPSAPRVRWAKGRVQVYEQVGGGAGEVRVLVDIRAGEGEKCPL